MKKIFFIIFIFFLYSFISAKIIVFPFKANSPEKKTHQWLGKAISFYLTTSLQLNSFETLSDNKVKSILDLKNVNFPYNITKASKIKLAMDFGANIIVGGEIISSNVDNQSFLEVNSYIIDLKKYTQRYLPLIKGHVKDLFKIQKELLNYVLKYFNKNENEVFYPELNLNNHGYEIFIKSYLLDDVSHKIKLLEKAYKLNLYSDFLNFELSKCYLNQGELGKSEIFLGKISNKFVFKYEKIFLIALLYYYKKDLKGANVEFKKLLKENQFDFEVNNNLGVLCFKEKKYESAEKHFIYSLNLSKDSIVYLNYIKLLLITKYKERASEVLNSALFYFPVEKKLIDLFSYFLSKNDKKDLLFNVFGNYIPDIYMDDNEPDIPLNLKSIFDFEFESNINYSLEVSNIRNLYNSGNIEETFEKLQDLLEVNPFVPEFHSLMSRIYFLRKQLYKAEMYALSALFLKKSEKNFLELIKIYKSKRDKVNLIQVISKALELFPESEKIKKFTKFCK